MTTTPYTIAIVVYPDGQWSIVSHDQSPEKLTELRAVAKERGATLVRYPMDSWESDELIDFSLALDLMNP